MDAYHRIEGYVPLRDVYVFTAGVGGALTAPFAGLDHTVAPILSVLASLLVALANAWLRKRQMERDGISEQDKAIMALALESAVREAVRAIKENHAAEIANLRETHAREIADATGKRASK